MMFNNQMLSLIPA